MKFFYNKATHLTLQYLTDSFKICFTFFMYCLFVMDIFLYLLCAYEVYFDKI